MEEITITKEMYQNMGEITITKEMYQGFLKDRYFADAMRNLLRDKRTKTTGIYADEVALICKLYGIEDESE